MGTISKGILGGFSGKVGNVSGANWNGINVIRSLPGKRAKSTNQVILAQQARFKMAVAFVQAFGDLWTLTYSLRTVRMSSKNRALSHLLNNAVVGNYPDISIDFSKVLISSGNLPGVIAVKAVSTEAGQVEFSWTDNSGIASARPDDQSILAVYDPVTGHAVYTAAGALRGAGKAVLDAGNLKGAVVHAYVGFISKTGNKVANSIYTGEVTIAV